MVFLNGCKPKEEPSKPVLKADPPSVYMKDPAFRAKLEQQNAARNELANTRERLMVELESRVDAMRAKMEKEARTVSDADIKKELEKDPEWNSLARRIRKLNEALEDNRAATTEVVRERIKARPVDAEK